MADNLQETRRTQFLLINLVLLVVLILFLALVIGAYNLYLAPEPTPTPTITFTPEPSFTPSQTPTITLTPTASHTPRPSLTPTITWTPSITPEPSSTFTPPGPATLTPARPNPSSAGYKLKPWTVDDMDYQVRLMEDFPNSLAEDARGEDNQAYFAAFRFAVTAQREALLRFPDAPQAETWRWGLAYNLARTSDPASGEIYRDLILDGLNSGETDLSDLYIWFQKKEPRFELYLTPQNTPAGYLGSYLIEVRGAGSAFIWLLESDSGYRAYSLLSNFNFSLNPEASWVMAELDGEFENGEEIAIYFSAPRKKQTLDPPQVFNLNQIPARELLFIPETAIFDLGLDYKNNWAIRMNEQGYADLLFSGEVFPPCSVTVERQYHWDGETFALAQANFLLASTPLTLAYCDEIRQHAAYTWGAAAVIQIMEALLPDWPPDKNLQGMVYPPEAKDEWLYRLGIAYALTGDREGSLKHFNQIIQTPSVPRSSWIAPAQDFLDHYTSDQDIYRACVLTTYCQPAEALQTLVRFLPPGQEILPYLWDTGVSVTASGYFDFDQDGESERWIDVRHRTREKPEFWILAAHPGGFEALRIDQVNANPPSIEILDEAFIAESSLHLQPAIFLDGSLAFHMQRLPRSEVPYITPVALRDVYPDRYLAVFHRLQKALFDGEPPKSVMKDLQALAVYPGLLCKNTWSCDPYYYMLGLASELAGDTRAAVDAYHKLWSDYSKSPYTIMARIKLMGSALQTLTPTPTYTPTTTVTPEPSLTPTLTVTGTPPTSTPTPTLTYTPDPNATPTETPTLTPTVTSTLNLTETPTITPSPTGTITTTP